MKAPAQLTLGNAGIQFIDGDRSARYPKREEYLSSGVLFLNGESIHSGVINRAAANYISEHKYADIKKGRIAKGDILLTTRGNSVGDAAFVNIDDKGLINAQMLILRANKQSVDSRFLFFYLTSDALRGYIANFASGSAQPQIPIRDLRKIPIRLPRHEVQKKIAAILSAYDELRENSKRRIALLERMAEEIYREWFVRLRFPGHESARFVKGIPAMWSIKSLEEIASFTMGQSPPSESYNESGDGLPFHQGVGTYGDRFPQKLIYCKDKGRMAKQGDILFSVRAPVGRLNIADSDMIIGRGLAAIRHKAQCNSYLFYLLRTTFANEDIIGNGSIFNSVGKDELAKFKVLQPDEPLIKRFQAVAGGIDRQIELLSRSVALLTETRNRLLPRLISGKLSVECLGIEVPSSMLEEQVTWSPAVVHA